MSNNLIHLTSVEENMKRIPEILNLMLESLNLFYKTISAAISSSLFCSDFLVGNQDGISGFSLRISSKSWLYSLLLFVRVVREKIELISVQIIREVFSQTFYLAL
ncbi:hypothetical protein MIMGU_mgv11b014128mg [Erythranthe guttata]|uniref:Uncharacterized protein n=1 Tax=Erythranthe guttata TaxID=4155 RepID=A0A022QIZ9_ERYGU|nr:hypothetical protein MIMGU_mgv11b014128mg [Erythranthe guttata]